MGDPQAAFEAFTSAIAHDPKDPDIYYHRGQGEERSALLKCSVLTQLA